MDSKRSIFYLTINFLHLFIMIPFNYVKLILCATINFKHEEETSQIKWHFFSEPYAVINLIAQQMHSICRRGFTVCSLMSCVSSYVQNGQTSLFQLGYVLTERVFLPPLSRRMLNLGRLLDFSQLFKCQQKSLMGRGTFVIHKKGSHNGYI